MIKQKYIGLSWGREYSSLPLEGWVNFLTLTKQADDVSKTKTFVYKASISTVVNDLLRTKDYDYYVSYELKKQVDKLFRKSDIVKSNEVGADRSVKINAFDFILETFRAGYPILDPLCFHYFGNNNFALHPGYTRLLFGNVYKEDVDCIIFDYTNGKVQDDFKHINIITPDETFIDVKEKRYLFGHTGIDNSPRQIHKLSGNKDGVMYRELLGKNPIPDELADPRLYNPPRTYKKEKEVVTVDGRKVLERNKGSWELTL